MSNLFSSKNYIFLITRILILFALSTLLISCHRGDEEQSNYGVEVTGLNTGKSIVMTFSGSSVQGFTTFTVTSNEKMGKSWYRSGDLYKLVIETQPNDQTCTVTNSTGTVPNAYSRIYLAVNCINNSSKYAYITSDLNRKIYQFSIDSDGNLVAMSPAYIEDVGLSPLSLVVDASGKYGYVPNGRNDSISQYTIGSTGGLTPMSPATVPAGVQPLSLAIDPTSQYAYAANVSSGTITQYKIGSNGALAPLSVPLSAPAVEQLIIDESGKYLYATASGATSIFQFKIGADGVLVANATADISLGSVHAMASFGKYVYVTDLSNNSVSQYAISTDGPTIGQLIRTSTSLTVPSPTGVSFDSNKSNLYVTSMGGSIYQFAIGSGGTVTALSPVSVASTDFPQAGVVNANNLYFYVVTTLGIDKYGVDANGKLSTSSASTKVINAPSAITLIKQ